VAEFWFRLISQKMSASPQFGMNSICLFNDFIRFCSLALSYVVRRLYHELFAGFNSGCLLDLSSVVPGRTASLHVSALAQSRGEQQSETDPRAPCTVPRSAPTIHTVRYVNLGNVWCTLWWYAAVLWIIWVEDIYVNLNGYNEKWNPGIRSPEHEKLTTTAAWTVLWIWIRILDSYCLETSFWLFILQKWCQCTFKK